MEELILFEEIIFVFFCIIENDCGDSSDEQNCQGEYQFQKVIEIEIFDLFLERTCDPLTQFTCPHTTGRCIPNGML